MVGGWSSATMLAALLADPATGGERLVLDECEGLPCSPETHGYAECEAR